MFSKISIAAVAALGLVAASPALADGKNSEPSATSSADQAANGPKTRYCVKAEPVTGSIRQGRMCKTAEQWRAEGVDVSTFSQRN